MHIEEAARWKLSVTEDEISVIYNALAAYKPKAVRDREVALAIRETLDQVL